MEKQFTGFNTDEESLIGIPDNFFQHAMLEIKDANLLKLILYMLWKAFTVGNYQICFSVANLMIDKTFINSLNLENKPPEVFLEDLLEDAVKAKILLEWKNNTNAENRFFINCDAGKAAHGNKDNTTRSSEITLDQITPNIYKIYAENIGPLTPLIADALREAESSYTTEWIKEAIQIAVENNVRRWRYIESILNRWQKEGRNGTNRRHDKTDYRSYLND